MRLIEIPLWLLFVTTSVAQTPRCPEWRWSAPVPVWEHSTEGPGRLALEGRPDPALAYGVPAYAVAYLTGSRFHPGPFLRQMVVARVGDGAFPSPPTGPVYRHPLAAVDATGALHLIWAEPARSADGVPPDRARRPPGREQLSRVLYATFRKGRWSPAEEIYSAPNLAWSAQLGSDLRVDSAGRLHVAFKAFLPTVGPTLVHLRSGPRGWRATELAAMYPHTAAHRGRASLVPNRRGGGSYPRLAFGSGGRVYLASINAVRDLADPARLRGNKNSVWIERSGDGGESWQAPVLVSYSGGQLATEPQLLVTGQDTVHLLWRKHLRGDLFFADAIWHAVSTNGGRTWTKPDSAPTPHRQRHKIVSVRAAADPRGEVHLVFSAYPEVAGIGTSQVYHTQWSGGVWSEPEKLDTGPSIVGFDLEVDKQGRPHLLWGFQRNRAFEPIPRLFLSYAARSPCRSSSASPK